MAREVHHGMIARDEYVVGLPQGLAPQPDVLSCGVTREPGNSASTNTTTSMLTVSNMALKRPVIPLATELRHVKKSRSKFLQFVCSVPECGEKFNTREYLCNHMKLHLGVKPFTCDVCSKVCQTESKLKAHVASHASDGIKPQCDICERSFSSRSALNKHRRMLHKPKPHTCPHCHSGFEERKYMVIHAKRAHEADLPAEDSEPQAQVPCPKPALNDPNANNCEEAYKESYPVLDSGHQPHSVPTLSDPLDVPKETTHGSPAVMMQKKDNDVLCAPSHQRGALITCEFCTSTFPSLAYLEQHMAVHFSEKTCHSCGMVFLNRHDLNNHVKLHTLEAASDAVNFASPNLSGGGSFSQFVPQPAQPGPSRGPQLFEKYVCSACNEQFLNLGSLKRHQAKGHHSATVLSV